MIFPNSLNIFLKNRINGEKLKIENVIISIHLFAKYRNDYHLGPFFSNEMGEYFLNSNILIASAEAELATGLMDYEDYHNCKDEAVIKILSVFEVSRLKNARKMWGILKDEKSLYESKEQLLSRIELSNNHKIEPSQVMVQLNTSGKILEVVFPIGVLGGVSRRFI